MNNDLKHYKQFIYEMSEEMLEAEILFTPENLKYDQKGKLLSYDIKAVIDIDGMKQELKDKALIKGLVSYLSDSKIRKSISINPHVSIFNAEVYANTDTKKGIVMYVYFGNKKVNITF